MTAAERRLWDPFDPVQALPKSAEFLRELRAQFGNLGLAAAAYNAGPQRIRDWLAGKRTLPSETEAYVRKITGHAAQEWARPRQQSATLTIPAGNPLRRDGGTCCDGETGDQAAAGVQRGANEPTSVWGGSTHGDRSEITALASYYQLQKKIRGYSEAIYPWSFETTLKGTAVPIWSRVHIARREAASVVIELPAADAVLAQSSAGLTDRPIGTRRLSSADQTVPPAVRSLEQSTCATSRLLASMRPGSRSARQSL